MTSEDPGEPIPSAAFLLKDEPRGLESLIYTTCQKGILHTEIYPEIEEEVLQHVIPYAVARYYHHFEIGSKPFAVTNTNPSQRLMSVYEWMREYAEEHPGLKRSIAQILYGTGRRLAEHAEHSKPIGYIPDIHHMDITHFNKWARYFEEGWKKHGQD